MATYEYRIVPFIGDVKGSVFRPDDARRVAEQLEAVITANATDGWEFYRVDQVQIAVSPGCLGSLLGQKQALVSYDQVSFRREAGS